MAGKEVVRDQPDHSAKLRGEFVCCENVGPIGSPKSTILKDARLE
jgi:hypothetical protein